jgi:hypothetical protein
VSARSSIADEKVKQRSYQLYPSMSYAPQQMLARAQRPQITIHSPGHRSPPQDEDSELERKLQKAVTALQRWRQKFEMEVAANKELGRRVRSWKQLCKEESCKRDAAEAALQAADMHFNEQLRECLQQAATEKAVLEAELRACKRHEAQDRRAAARKEAALEAQILQLQLSLQGCGRNDASCRAEPVTPVTKPARPTAELRALSALSGSKGTVAAAVPAPPSSSSSGSGSGVRQSGPRRRQHSAVTPLQVTPLQDTNLWSSPIKSAAAAERSSRHSSGTCKRLLSSLELSSDNSSCGGATARFAAVLDSTAESWCDNGRACSDSDSDSDTEREHTAGVDAPLSVTRSLDSGGGNFSSDDDGCSDDSNSNSYTYDSYSRCGAPSSSSRQQLQLDSPLRAEEQQLQVCTPGCDSPNASDVPPLALQMSYVSASSQSLSLSPPSDNGVSHYGGVSPCGESLLYGANLQFEQTEQGPVKQQLAVCIPSVSVERHSGFYEHKQRGSSGDVHDDREQQHSHSWSDDSDSNDGSSSNSSSTELDSSFAVRADADNSIAAANSSAAVQDEHDELVGVSEPHSEPQQLQQHFSLVQRDG